MGLRNRLAALRTAALPWAGDRARDLSLLPVELMVNLPARLVRLGRTLRAAPAGVADALPEAMWLLRAGDAPLWAAWARASAAGAGFWFLGVATRLFDLTGGPEVGEFLLHLATDTSPLKEAELEAAKPVLGPHAICWREIRVAQRGVLNAVFRLNGGRAFAVFHTVNMPTAGYSARSDLKTIVHELTHVLQYEQLGSIYIVQALRAQATAENYDYGGEPGLRERRSLKGQHLWDLNPEQQASVAGAYYERCLAAEPGPDLQERFASYQPWIEELQARRV